MAQHPFLRREKPIVPDLEDGMREYIRMKKPVVSLRLTLSPWYGHKRTKMSHVDTIYVDTYQELCTVCLP